MRPPKIMTDVVSVIQARTGSTRLPGKVMYPLAGRPNIAHVIKRAVTLEHVDETIVATSSELQDDVIARFSPQYDADMFRGSEENVLDRFYSAANQYDPEIVVRITGDCPLVSPRFIKHGINYIENSDADYVTAGLNRTFPRGTTAEVFSFDSFTTVRDESTKDHHREHVTPYYRENPDQFTLHNVLSKEVFQKKVLYNRTDLRLTLDEAADYELLNEVYSGVDFAETLDIYDAIDYIDRNDLKEINQHVEQKAVQ